MASVVLPTPARARSRSESRPSVVQDDPQSPRALAAPARPPRSLSRPSPPKINIDIQAILQQSTPRNRGLSGGLALQARDSVSVRKRTMSTGAMSARTARYNARRAKTDLLQPALKRPDRSPSPSVRHQSRSRSPAGTPSTRTNSHPGRLSHSPSTSSSSSSQSRTPITPGHPPISGGPPSSYQLREHTHIPHNSQGTNTSAYPPSSSHSSRSASPSPEDRSRTPSPLPRPQKSSIHSVHNSPSLDLDPDDVNARLRLLVNNSYFLPPAHTKPELSPIRPYTVETRGATSPSAFKEFFRVGKKRDKKAMEMSGYASEGARHAPGGKLLRVPPEDSPRSLSSGSDGQFGVGRHGDGYFDLTIPEERARNRVVVVRETVDDLPPPVARVPFRNVHPVNALDTIYNDPTTQYDTPPPNHFPSYTDLRLDAAGITGITGNVELDQFAPPGEPWSPAPTSPQDSGSGVGMDPQERVWRRNLLEQAVDLSLSSAGSDPGNMSPSPRERSFSRGARMMITEEILEPTSPKSPKSKKSWWGRKEKDVEETLPRRSTSSLQGRDVTRNGGTERGGGRSLDAQPSPSPHRGKRDLGQRILPNVHIELEQLEREQAQREMEQRAGLPPPLRLKPMRSAGGMSVSAPVTPLYQHDPGTPDTPTLPLTPLRPPPAVRRSDPAWRRDAFGDLVPQEFIPGHSTIRKSLSSPLLSDLHETGVDVQEREQEQVQYPSVSSDSMDGIAAPSLVLQDPHGVTSLVASHTMDSYTSGSHYSDDSHDMFDPGMPSDEHQYGYRDDDGVSLERWTPSLAGAGSGEGRPSFDSFGARRMHTPECPPRASSTFGFRRSNASVTTPSPLRRSAQDIEVDISGDPIEHLSMMESQRSHTPSIDSHIDSHASSVRGYASALDHTFAGSEAPSMRPSSPGSGSFRSTRTRLASIKSLPIRAESPTETTSPPPISFFDSVQNQSYLDGDDGSSDSDAEAEHVENAQFAVYPERSPQTQTLGRKSLSMTRPTPAFSTQFRNASQPQLPVSRADVATASLDTALRPIQPYDLLDRKKPLTNTPSSPISQGGFLSQLKAKPGKSSPKLPGRPFSSKGKKSSGPSPVMLPESTFELLRYPQGTAFALGSRPDTATGSDDSIEVRPGGFEGVRSQDSLPSLQSADSASIDHVNSWRREQSAQNDSMRKLDGMMLQHLEAEKDRLRKIASAAREQSGRSR